MNVNLSSAHAARGSYTPGRGDVTGKKFVSNADEKQRREQATRNTRNALQSEAVTVVDVPGGRSFAIPREVFNQVVAMAEEQGARHE